MGGFHSSHSPQCSAEAEKTMRSYHSVFVLPILQMPQQRNATLTWRTLWAWRTHQTCKEHGFSFNRKLTNCFQFAQQHPQQVFSGLEFPQPVEEFALLASSKPGKKI